MLQEVDHYTKNDLTLIMLCGNKIKAMAESRPDCIALVLKGREALTNSISFSADRGFTTGTMEATISCLA